MYKHVSMEYTRVHLSNVNTTPSISNEWRTYN